MDRGSFQPLSAERIQVKFTASRELEEKIALARDLMSHKNPRGDLATIFETALDLWIEHALKKKLGKTERPRKTPRQAKPSRVTNATRREVHDRDGLACSFVSDAGERCGARAFLELDHRKTKGNGGGPGPDNMRMLCRAHNQAEAERVYGKAHMERSRRRVSGKKGGDGVKERTSTHDFVVGLLHPRRNGSASSAGRSELPAASKSVNSNQGCLLRKRHRTRVSRALRVAASTTRSREVRCNAAHGPPIEGSAREHSWARFANHPRRSAGAGGFSARDSAGSRARRDRVA